MYHVRILLLRNILYLSLSFTPGRGQKTGHHFFTCEGTTAQSMGMVSPRHTVRPTLLCWFPCPQRLAAADASDSHEAGEGLCA